MDTSRDSQQNVIKRTVIASTQWFNLRKSLKETHSLMNATQEDRQLIEAILTKIKEIAQQIEPLLEEIGEQESGSRTSPTTYWKLEICHSTLRKVKLFLNQNFTFIEPLATLAIARYISELTILLKLIQKNEQYALLYYHEIIQARLRDKISQHQKLLQEIDFLRKAESEDEDLLSILLPIDSPQAVRMGETEDQKVEDYHKKRNEFDERVDKEFSRMLSLYVDISEARRWGYGYLAHLIENQLLDRYKQSVAKEREELSAFQQTIAKNLELPVLEQWNWKDLAKQVDMESEYDFIHSYVENMLHATPISLMTNQQNLEFHEIKILLRYITTRLSDVTQIVKELIHPRNLNPTET